MLATLALTVAPGESAAKEGTRAIVLSGLPTDARAGTTITVRWKLIDADGHPVDLLEALMRLLGPGGVPRLGIPLEASHPDGVYAARVRVPPGGAVAVQFGLADGGSTSFFPVRNDPYGGWSSLYRPLHVPSLSSGDGCPTSSIDTSIDFGTFGVSAGWGPGPAYPIGLTDGTVAVTHDSPVVSARSWGVQKILWFVHPRYGGLVLIRGRQLDGSSILRFERGSLPPPELRLPRAPRSSTGGRTKPSFVRVKNPGCYAFQIDGTSFSRLIVFRVVTQQ